jgi:exopolysaccharide biosynthesis polyprenyl glycosylphosphotransferase
MAVVQAEQELSSRLVGWRSGSPATLDVEGKILARRRLILALRRDLILADTLLAGAVALLSLHLGHRGAAAMSLVVLAAAVGHACSADSPRGAVSSRAVVRSGLMLSAIACAVTAVAGRAGSGSLGRELLAGSSATLFLLVLVRLSLRASRLSARYGLGRRSRIIVGDPRALEGMAARRLPAVESGEVILVITRAERRRGGDSEDGLAGTEDRRSPPEPQPGSGPAGVVARVVRTALDNGSERVTVIPGDSWGQQQLRELSWSLEGTGIDMVIATNLDGIAPHRVDVEQQDGRLMIRVGSASPHGTARLVKGLLDRLGAAVLLVVSSPALLVMALAVRSESTGPAIFSQTRVREGGVPFTMYKFRTMRADAEAQLAALRELSMHAADGPLFKMRDDPRITRVGQLLRKTSLDELPQLVNVLKGEMSLIGPRPALPHEVEMYDYVARRRLAVKPGMTGLWQVSGRSSLTWDESIGYDLDYVDNWSPGTDASIAVRTFRAVVTKDGAF